MPPKNETSVNDFGKNKFVTKVMEDLAALSSDIRQPDKFAQIFCEAAKTQKSIDAALKNVLIHLLHNDIDAHNTITAIIEKVDRGYGRLLFGKAAAAVWLIAGMLINALLHKYLR